MIDNRAITTDEWQAIWYAVDEIGYVTGFGCPSAWATVIGNIHDNPELLGGKDDG